MAITGFNESSITTSEIWKKLNEMNPKETMQQRAIKLIKGDAKVITNEDIEPAYIAVKQITDSLTVAALKAFDSQRVVLLYNQNANKSINQAVPFLTFKTKDGYVTYIFANNKYIVNKNGVYTIQAPIFRDLITGAVVANAIRSNYSALASNQYLQKILMEIYCAFFTRILNREYSIMSDKVTFDKIQYWVNKFFLLHVFGIHDTEENVDTLASKHVKFLDEIGVEEMKNKFQEADPKTVSDLLEMLRGEVSRMKSLNLGTFLSDWINYYYPQSMLAVDNIEYLVFMTICLLSGNNIINISAGDIVKEAKSIKQFRGELLKLI